MTDIRAKVLITGGAGFLGYHLAVKLIEKNFSVVLVDNFSRGVSDPHLVELSNSEHCELLSLDCLDRNQLMQLDVDFNYIFHLAAIIGVVHVNERPASVILDNLNMLANMLDVARRQTKLSRFMFPSTSEVVAGTLEHFELEIPTPESTPLAVTELTRPRTSYMLSKIAGECLCHYSDIPYTIFRPHNIYGPRMGTIHVVPGQLRKAYDAIDGGTVQVPSVDQTRCFCFVHDACEMLIKMMLSEGCQGQTLNLGAPGPEITIGEIAKICHSAVGRDVKIFGQPSPPGSPVRRAPCMKKTESLIGTLPNTPLKNGVDQTFQWYEEHVFRGDGITAR